MTSENMTTWIRTCFDTTEPFIINSEKHLIMDEFSSHMCDELMKILEKNSMLYLYISYKDSLYSTIRYLYKHHL